MDSIQMQTCLRDPIPEIAIAAQYLEEAVTAHLQLRARRAYIIPNETHRPKDSTTHLIALGRAGTLDQWLYASPAWWNLDIQSFVHAVLSTKLFERQAAFPIMQRGALVTSE